MFIDTDESRFYISILTLFFLSSSPSRPNEYRKRVCLYLNHFSRPFLDSLHHPIPRYPFEVVLLARSRMTTPEDKQLNYRAEISLCLITKIRGINI